MEIEYSRELDNRFVILPEPAPGEDYVWRMLAGRRFAFLLQPVSRSSAGERKVAYAVDGLTSLETLLVSRPILPEEMRSLLGALYRCCGMLEEYLLPPDSLVLESGLIFRRQEEWVFLLLPGREEELYEQLQKLSRFLLRKCNHEDPAAAEQAYELFRVCHEENVSFTQIREVLGLDSEAASRPEAVSLPGGRRKTDPEGETGHAADRTAQAAAGKRRGAWAKLTEKLRGAKALLEED